MFYATVLFLIIIEEELHLTGPLHIKPRYKEHSLYTLYSSSIKAVYRRLGTQLYFVGNRLILYSHTILKESSGVRLHVTADGCISFSTY